METLHRIDYSLSFLFFHRFTIIVDNLLSSVEYFADSSRFSFFMINSLSACFCNQHPVDLLLQCFLSSCFPKGLQRSCLKALSPLQIVPSTIWRNAISLGNGCRCPFDKISVPSVFQKSYESDFVKIKKPTQFQLLQKSKIHRLIPLT